MTLDVHSMCTLHDTRYHGVCSWDDTRYHGMCTLDDARYHGMCTNANCFHWTVSSCLFFEISWYITEMVLDIAACVLGKILDIMVCLLEMILDISYVYSRRYWISVLTLAVSTELFQVA